VFDFIIVDTRSSLHDIELTILEVAARVILITTPEIPAIKNAKVFFDVTSALEYPPDKVVMVLNEVDRRGAIRAEDIEASIRHPISGTIPSDGRAAYVAANQGVPMVVSHRNSPTAQSIVDLSRRLVASLQPQSEAAAGNGGKSSSLLGKLFR
jgi:pilus assembly protein CpaE